MKERPILFSGPMVRAILEGWKTQTRRVYHGVPPNFYPSASGGCWGIPIGEREKCPFGQPGDRLWVRETWAPHADIPRSAIYRCDPGGDYQDTVTPNFRWRPSIHMPRWASRLTLEITAVRVERLRDISEENAMAEGLDVNTYPEAGGPVDAFAGLWMDIYGLESWASNPWVWVVEFRKVEDKR